MFQAKWFAVMVYFQPRAIKWDQDQESGLNEWMSWVKGSISTELCCNHSARPFFITRRPQPAQRKPTTALKKTSPHCCTWKMSALPQHLSHPLSQRLLQTGGVGGGQCSKDSSWVSCKKKHNIPGGRNDQFVLPNCRTQNCSLRHCKGVSRLSLPS